MTKMLALTSIFFYCICLYINSSKLLTTENIETREIKYKDSELGTWNWERVTSCEKRVTIHAQWT